MIKKVLSLAFLCVAVILSSCSKDPTSGNNPGGFGGGNPAGDALTKIAEDMGKDMGELMTSEGFVATARVAGKITSSDAFNFGGFGSNKSGNNYTAAVLKKLKNNIVRSIYVSVLPKYIVYKYDNKPNSYNKSDDSDSTRFNFDQNTGVYQYDEAADTWNQVGSSNYMIFKMDVDVPDAQDTSIHYTKTAQLTIYNWDEQKYHILNADENVYEDSWMPTGIKMDLKLEGEIVAALDYAASWDATTLMPLNLSVSLNLTPYALNVNYADGGNNITASMAVTNSGATMIGFGASINFNNRNAGEAINLDDNNKATTSIKNLTAYAQFSTLKIEGMVNVEAMENLSDPTPAQLNQNVQISVTNNGQPVGTIEFYKKTPSDSTISVRIIFEDGTEGNIDDYFGDIINSVDSLIGNDDSTGTNNRMVRR